MALTCVFRRNSGLNMSTLGSFGGIGIFYTTSNLLPSGLYDFTRESARKSGLWKSFSIKWCVSDVKIVSYSPRSFQFVPYTGFNTLASRLHIFACYPTTGEVAEPFCVTTEFVFYTLFSLSVLFCFLYAIWPFTAKLSSWIIVSKGFGSIFEYKTEYYPDHGIEVYLNFSILPLKSDRATV